MVGWSHLFRQSHNSFTDEYLEDLIELYRFVGSRHDFDQALEDWINYNKVLKRLEGEN